METNGPVPMLFRLCVREQDYISAPKFIQKRISEQKENAGKIWKPFMLVGFFTFLFSGLC